MWRSSVEHQSFLEEFLNFDLYVYPYRQRKKGRETRGKREVCGSCQEWRLSRRESRTPGRPPRSGGCYLTPPISMGYVGGSFRYIQGLVHSPNWGPSSSFSTHTQSVWAGSWENSSLSISFMRSLDPQQILKCLTPTKSQSTTWPTAGSPILASLAEETDQSDLCLQCFPEKHKHKSPPFPYRCQILDNSFESPSLGLWRRW